MKRPIFYRDPASTELFAVNSDPALPAPSAAALGRDITENYHGGAETSVSAHASTSAEHRAATCRRILDRIAIAPEGITADELEGNLGMLHQSCSARISELLAAGAIRHSGKRKTRTGRMARIYFLATPDLQERA